MAYTTEQLRALFQSPFNKSSWTEFIIYFFKAQTLHRVPEPLDINPDDGTGYYWGKLSTCDTYEISFFYLKMNNSIDRRKVGLRQLIERYIKIDSDAGIAVFDDGNHWRLSFITDMRGEKTSPKRNTFVFGDPENHYLTPVSRFLELQKKGISYENIRNAFSVEALTTQFYNDLYNWYLWALDPTSGVYFPNKPNTIDDDLDHLDTKMIRLITRLMFVWFIKQKDLVPDDLFNPHRLAHILTDFDPQSMSSSNYYQAILQNLFFATLNRPIKTVTYDKDGNEQVERRCFAKMKDKPDVKSKYRYEDLFKISEDKILSLFEFIPFINGGLFECLDKNKTSDGVDQAYYHDGFSRNNTIIGGHFTRRAFIPNKLFFDPEDGIISIFRRYNFTVEENSPSEQQIALDPELLGKVFENLLGVYNPETQDTARNQSGSFYTPREIVNYMVDISLQAYLGNTEEVKQLFKEDFEYDESRKEFYDGIIVKLKAIKVLDPACGSGAFPMGMLNRIVEILLNLHAPGRKYDLKLAIMENCIFGGDIQTIAAQITKLRFFISLVCDCEKNDNADDNFGIPNLPNLETHFVTADSLIVLKHPKQYSLFEQDVIELQKKLQQVRHEHFMAKTVYQKTKLRDQDKQLRDELVELLKSDNVIASENAYQMAQWNPYDQNGKSPFFDPKWMFGIEDGFDVVIGNPPYIRLDVNKGKLAKLYEPCNYEVFDNKGNIYCLFYERGLKMLRQHGILTYITLNKWMRADYGKKLRNFFTGKANPTILVDFGGVQVFESANVDTNILLLRKEKNNNRIQSTELKLKDAPKFSSLDKYVVEHHSYYNFHGSDCWVVMSNEKKNIKKKVEEKGISLRDWKVQINYGIKTGCDKAFWIDSQRREEILSWCTTEKERENTKRIIRPLLRGKDIKKYGCRWADIWLINTHNGVKRTVSRINIDDYPAIKKHLDDFYERLTDRSDKGDTPYNLRNCAYIMEFNKQKIIFPETTKYLPFVLDNGEYLTNKTCFIVVGQHVAYLTAFLNSSLFKYCFIDDFPPLGEDRRGLGKTYFEKIPVLEVDDATNAEFRSLVLDIQNEYSDEKAKAIDQRIFDLYGLSSEERAAIGYIDFHSSKDDEADDDE